MIEDLLGLSHILLINWISCGMNLAFKELSLKERYESLLENSILMDAINYAFHKEVDTLEKYYEFYLQAQKRMLPSYLGTVYGVFKTLSPGRAFKQVINQLMAIIQMHYDLSTIDFEWLSDREVRIGIKNCPKRQQTGEFAKKAGLNINPIAMCAFEGRFFRDIFKEFGIDMNVTFTKDGCDSIAKMS